MKRIKTSFVRAARWTYEMWEDGPSDFIMFSIIGLAVFLFATFLFICLIALFITFPIIMFSILVGIAILVGIPTLLIRAGRRYSRLEVEEGWD